MNFELALIIIEYIGTIAFAISGAIIAIENKMDILGVTILGTTTAVGGGIMRDIIIGKDDISVVNVCIKILSNFDLILFIMFFSFDSII